MEPVGLDYEDDLTQLNHRARRGVAVISASLLAITVAGVGFLHPTLPSIGLSAWGGGPATHATYRVVAAEFVDRHTGWVVARFPSGDYAILHTTDGARSWTRQLSVAGDTHPVFMKFFNRATGVFALVGTSPLLRRTSDGGRTWSSLPGLGSTTVVASWSFADVNHGWMLAYDAGSAQSPAAKLYRTDDGGRRWAALGPPVAAPDRAYQVHFSSFTTGWLTTAGAGAYAYRTSDLGATWSRVPLPPLVGGWPHAGEFLVALQPTAGGGAVASVVYFPAIKGRSGIGGSIRAFPPLTVRGFDGGRPHTYLYGTLIDQLVGSPWTQEPAPNQVKLSTSDDGAAWKVIAPPSTAGTIGFVDASNWWWVSAGLWSKSQDGGATWSDPRGAGVVEPQPGTLRVLDRDHAWVAGAGGWRPVIQGTDDGGASWRLLPLPAIADVPTL